MIRMINYKEPFFSEGKNPKISPFFFLSISQPLLTMDDKLIYKYIDMNNNMRSMNRILLQDKRKSSL